MGPQATTPEQYAARQQIHKAVAQQYLSALYVLSDLYLDGLPSVLRKSQEKANDLLLKSANLGFGFANRNLARVYLKGLDGFEKDRAEAYFRASVAFALDSTDKGAALLMGLLHHGEADTIEPSPYLAC